MPCLTSYHSFLVSSIHALTRSNGRKARMERRGTEGSRLLSPGFPPPPPPLPTPPPHFLLYTLLYSIVPSVISLPRSRSTDPTDPERRNFSTLSPVSQSSLSILSGLLDGSAHPSHPRSQQPCYRLSNVKWRRVEGAAEASKKRGSKVWGKQKEFRSQENPLEIMMLWRERFPRGELVF